MTTRVLMTTVLQKRRAQWSLLPKSAQPKVPDLDEPMADADEVVAKASTPRAAGAAAAVGRHRPN